MKNSGYCSLIHCENRMNSYINDYSHAHIHDINNNSFSKAEREVTVTAPEAEAAAAAFHEENKENIEMYSDIENADLNVLSINSKKLKLNNTTNKHTRVEDIIRQIIQENQDIITDNESEIYNSQNFKIASLINILFPKFKSYSMKLSQNTNINANVEIRPFGTGKEIMLQGFNWESHKSDWYVILMNQMNEMASLGLTMIWFPPSSDSVSYEGYLPKDLYNLNSRYGNENQLRECIRLAHKNKIKVIGDLVLNHRCASFQNKNGIWNQFGGKLKWDAKAIIGNDPNYEGQGNYGNGEIFHAAPNIDHSQNFVRQDIKEWMKWLRDNIGYDGWRFDFVRGYDGIYIKEYISHSQPYFSVGEFWDSLAYNENGILYSNQNEHRQRLCDWINQTGAKSTAFDVTTKGILHAVFERNEYWRLKDDDGKCSGLIGWWPSHAVTFLENHDTGSTQGHWRFPEFALEQGYVYILTHPGTPTIFYDHLFYWSGLRETIGMLIATRKKYNIHCCSSVSILIANSKLYVAKIDDKIIIKIGIGHYNVSCRDWRVIGSGYHWAIWERINKES